MSNSEMQLTAQETQPQPQPTNKNKQEGTEKHKKNIDKKHYHHQQQEYTEKNTTTKYTNTAANAPPPPPPPPPPFSVVDTIDFLFITAHENGPDNLPSGVLSHHISGA